jgi:hypothetical protein
VTKAGLYHHISSKEALFFEIPPASAWTGSTRTSSSRWGIEDPGPSAQKPGGTLLTACNEPWITEVWADAGPAAADRETILLRKNTYVGMVRHMFNELAAAGRLRDLDHTVAVYSALGIVWIPRWLNEGAAVAGSGRRRRDFRAERAAQTGHQDARHRHRGRCFRRSPQKFRISPTSSSGCSSAAKCPPRGISV